MAFESNKNTVEPPDPREPWPFLKPSLILIGLLSLVGLILNDWSVLGASGAFLVLLLILIRDWRKKGG